MRPKGGRLLFGRSPNIAAETVMFEIFMKLFFWGAVVIGFSCGRIWRGLNYTANNGSIERSTIRTCMALQVNFGNFAAMPRLWLFA